MNIVFVSNFFNHHQKSLSDELWKLSEGNYTFLETCTVPLERVKLGYGTVKEQYVISFFDANEKENAELAIKKADVFLVGSTTDDLIRKIVKTGRPIFRYSERLFKERMKTILYPLYCVKLHLLFPSRKNILFLCAGGFVADDYRKMGYTGCSMYKWGYFPERYVYRNINELVERKKRFQILWVGRFLDWKHPDEAINVAKRLKEIGYKFSLLMIGAGNMENKLRNQVKYEKLEDCVFFLGAMSPDKVRCIMEESELFLFTSDRKEGWGAVVNEAMNSGCVVIASNLAGAVPYLIDDTINGYIYNSNDVDDLFFKVKTVFDLEASVRKEVAKEAYKTIINLWNAKKAAERLYMLMNNVITHDKSPSGFFVDGPCSDA